MASHAKPPQNCLPSSTDNRNHATAQEQASQDTHTQPEQQLRVDQPRARTHTAQAIQPRVEPRSPAAQASKPRDKQLGIDKPRAYAPQAFEPADEQR
ncbi:hypothetical protein EYR36_008201 [Pleurotus pulmonarius]|nr:hypothetical protein EYR36_008201 [Pleurotus pulmonarius]KAF4605970.1 hypothetical protein EYR38_000015 [Pleurotus pulmonarius]